MHLSMWFHRKTYTHHMDSLVLTELLAFSTARIIHWTIIVIATTKEMYM